MNRPSSDPAEVVLQCESVRSFGINIMLHPQRSCSVLIVALVPHTYDAKDSGRRPGFPPASGALAL